MDWLRNNVFEMSVLAVVGALAGIVGVAYGIYERWRSHRDQRPTLRVVVEERRNETSKAILFFRAINNGPIPVSVEFRGIVLPDGLGFYPTGPGQPGGALPKTLGVGEQITSQEWAPFVCGDLRRWGYSGQVAIRAWYEDGTGYVHRSDPHQITVDDDISTCTMRDVLRWVDDEVKKLRAGGRPDRFGPSGGLY